MSALARTTKSRNRQHLFAVDGQATGAGGPVGCGGGGGVSSGPPGSGISGGMGSAFPGSGGTGGGSRGSDVGIIFRSPGKKDARRLAGIPSLAKDETLFVALLRLTRLLARLLVGLLVLPLLLLALLALALLLVAILLRLLRVAVLGVVHR
jgi:hypothetical protein